MKSAVEKTTHLFTSKHEDDAHEEAPPISETKKDDENEKAPNFFGIKDSDVSEQTTNFFGTKIGENDEKTTDYLESKDSKHEETVEHKAPAEIISDFFATATSEADYVYLDNVPDEGIRKLVILYINYIVTVKIYFFYR